MANGKDPGNSWICHLSYPICHDGTGKSRSRMDLCLPPPLWGRVGVGGVRPEAIARTSPSALLARRDDHVEADLGGRDRPVGAVPADDDPRRLQAVEHLLDEGRDAVLELGHEVELP